jgi:hypothetical protein
LIYFKNILVEEFACPMVVLFLEVCSEEKLVEVTTSGPVTLITDAVCHLQSNCWLLNVEYCRMT